MRRTEAEVEVTKQDILESAVEAFGVAGYATTRLEDIASRAGVTRGAVYHHFGSKRGVLEALVETYAGGFDRVVEDALDSHRSQPDRGAAPLIEALMVNPLALIESDPHVASFFELALLRMGGTPELETIRRARRDWVEARLMAIGEAVWESAGHGLGVEPVAYGRLFVSVQQGVLATWLELGRSYSLVTAAEQAAQVLVGATAHAGVEAEGENA